MSPGKWSRKLGVSTLCVTAILGLVFGSAGWASDGSARRPKPLTRQPVREFAEEDHDEEVVGCGKGQAVRRIEEARRDLEARPSVQYLGAFEDTDILHYDLDIEVSNLNPGTNTCLIVGTNTMTIQSKSPGLTEFQFRLRSQFNITSALVNGTTPVPVTTESTSTKSVTLDRAYGVDEVFTLTIGYSGNTVSAFFGSIEVDTHSGIVPVVATLSEPYYAYTWWPVKDGDVGEPGDNSDKATVDFSITTQDDFQAPSNGVLVSTEMLSGNRTKYNWSTAYPIAPYLVSFAATQYTYWTEDYVHANGVMPVEFYMYAANASRGSNRAAWADAVDMLPVFGQFYGEYPFINEKYGIYNFPFGGGMEHQTMTGQGGVSESLTAHELAHQWWGDNVTCKTWHDIWLNEGFATYSECVWEENKTGTPNSMAYKNCILTRKPSNVGGSVYVYDTTDPNRIFSSTYSYKKAAWVLHQLRGVVGDAVFYNILAAHRATHQGSAATTDDFAAVASATAGQDLTWFFDQWVYQIGAPAYNFGWQNVSVAGQDYLLVRIGQTQSVTYPNIFTMPVELVATIGGSPSSIKVHNDQRTQWYTLPVTGPVTNLQFDPAEWILRTSAVNTGYIAGPPMIVKTEPAPGNMVEFHSHNNQIQVWFQTPVNTSSSHFQVVGAQTGVKSFTLLSASGVNPVVLQMNGALLPDSYTVTVADAVVAAESGAALDGEVTDGSDPESLPSGNGVAGGAAVFQFQVTGTIPAVSEWGLATLALLVACAGTLLVRPRRVACR